MVIGGNLQEVRLFILTFTHELNFLNQFSSFEPQHTSDLSDCFLKYFLIPRMVYSQCHSSCVGERLIQRVDGGTLGPNPLMELHAVHLYLLCAYCMQGTTLTGVGYTVGDKTKSLPTWRFHSSGGFRFRIDEDVKVKVK